MLEQSGEKFLPKCWRSVEIHPDLVPLWDALAQTQRCPYRVRTEIPWADGSQVVFKCSDPRALPMEGDFGPVKLTQSVDPASFCEPYDLYRRATGERSLLIIDGTVISSNKALPEGN